MSTGADSATPRFQRWNAVWGYDAEIVNVTGALAAVPPRASSRDALQRLTEAYALSEAFKYLDAHETDVVGVATLSPRIGSVGEPGDQLDLPSPAGEHLWDALVAEAVHRRPRAERVLRFLKGHVIVGQDTDSEPNLYSSGMSWLPKMDKDDFVASSRRALREPRREEKPSASRWRRTCRGPRARRS